MNNKGNLMGLATELGMTMGLTAAGFIYLGLWVGRQVDALLGTKPYATLMLLIAGVVIGQIVIIRLAIRTRAYLNEHEEPDYAYGSTGRAWKTLGRAFVCLALPVVMRLVGIWLDGVLGTGIVFALSLLALGLVIAVVGLLDIVEKLRVNSNEAKSE